MHVTLTDKYFNFLPTIISVALTAILVVTIWLCFSPGFMSPDSIAQYKQALTQQYTDSHPPLMSYLWHTLINLVDDDPAIFLFFHLSILTLGILIWINNMNQQFGSIFIPLIFFLPWIMNFAGVLWKDVGLAFSLLLATGLLFHKRTGWFMIAFATPFLFYATAIRHNAIFAVTPIIYFAAIYHFPTKKKWKAVVISLLSSLVLVVASSLMSSHIIGAEKKHFETFLMGDEIAKISAATGQNLLPDLKREDAITCSTYPILYERAVCFISKGYDASGSLVVHMDPETVRTIWLKTVLNNPSTYAAMKIDAFMYFLRSPSLQPYYVWHPGVMANEYNIKLNNPAYAENLERYVDESQKKFSYMFKPYTWLILCVVMLAAALSIKNNNRKKISILALNCSAAGYFLSYLLSAVSADFRYIYWCLIAISLSVVCYFINFISSKKSCSY